MTEKKDEINPKYLDRRVIERYIKRGQVDEKEFQKHLKALPDLAESAGSVETEFATAEGLGPTR